ncbi:aldo/keto reductase [Pradoshia sp. D12]|uniref:aldo/keto reductase n=1 Tax=Bacillaceae TaxID=186817 RepID=UPI001125F527|nr:MULTISPECIES: aldo/keto reductase [Bacillaceae]QFK71564.1 aldo/keto reductase [Pradoshia sp. D12]TPF73359.1 aldo/keto reductase [Bacillus sp. D12]
MNYRRLGNTDLSVSEISFGTWGIGGDWGKADTQDALLGLNRAMENGVNFFDTADVYGSGRSEELLREATKGKEDTIHIATKFCRAGDIHDPDTYSEEAIRAYCEGSLKRLGRERIDVYQIHCPPLHILKNTDVFTVLDKLQQEGKIRHYGVSVETVEEGLFCLTIPGVRALQVIFNIFRQKPLEELFPTAKKQGVGILARVPLASGLLTGKFSTQTKFEENDHRSFNANGEKFNVGETFAGLEFSKGVELSNQLSWIADGRGTMANSALRWILDHEEITCAIPGFKNAQQVDQNLKAIQTKSFSKEELDRLQTFYMNEVHDYIRGPY